MTPTDTDRLVEELDRLVRAPALREAQSAVNETIRGQAVKRRARSDALFARLFAKNENTGA
jgi:hypothetical protein